MERTSIVGVPEDALGCRSVLKLVFDSRKSKSVVSQ